MKHIFTVAVVFTICLLFGAIPVMAQSQLETDNAIEAIAVGDEDSYLAEALEEMLATPPNWGVIPPEARNQELINKKIIPVIQPALIEGTVYMRDVTNGTIVAGPTGEESNNGPSAPSAPTAPKAPLKPKL